ncbi:protein O-mannosyl-transferase TMTC3-like [Lytechinus variegatus]|uniref:protein O-mannosyl-transferase TMTC3-like n=1 Tax=Lytechinus variegatus TaxID=7654 RepID=UPI001BB2A680|nr:protein O-mannosyl-transferase TMTC3-like [Lytechinus variegatus]XP_041453073.1 protein O-mannosyl-transferase TMTC3-like [Lytechinus variegatus]
MATAFQRELFYSAGLLALVFACYSNSLSCGFVFDDVKAVVENRDLHPESSIFDLFSNDFWGMPMNKERSHKSYRPLCILTFRLNYAFGALNPWGYHLVNVLLHWAVCVLFLKAAKKMIDEESSVNASLLFAVHAVHTEAVTGVVGRAELLSSVFMLLAFMAYVTASETMNSTDWKYMTWSVLLIAMATISKEQGITMVGICCIYEVFFLQKFSLKAFIQQSKSRTSKTSRSASPNYQALLRAAPRLFFLIASSGLLLWGRMSIMGAKLPSFTRFDNPAALSAFPTRHLTYLYLLPINAWLLLCPSTLLCDWTMGTIPLVTSLGDPRNLATLLLLLSLGLLVLYAVFAEEKISCQLIMSLSFLVLPFLPASNLFFPVGFVVAERVLYTPSMGYCLLVAIAMERWHANGGTIKHVIGVIFAIILLLHAGKTIQRNPDWKDEYSLFTSAIKVTQNNAKLWNNVGHALEKENRWEDAFTYFNKAATVQPDDIGSWINVGRTYRQLGKLEEAETVYRKAMKFMPQPRKGEQYLAQIDPNHLNVYLNLANLIKKNESRLREAEELYLKVIRMRPDFVEAYINQGEILLKRGQLDEAESLYQQAARLDPLKADTHYNLGVVSMKKGQKPKALKHFDRAVEIDPRHKMALYNSALFIQESGLAARRKDAIKRLEKVLEIDSQSEMSFSTLGMLAVDDDDNQAALQYYQKALEINPSSRHALFNVALIHSDDKRPLQAKPYLETLLQYHPNHTKSMLLLGDIFLNSFQDVEKSKQLFQQIVDLEPSNIQARHNLCVVLVQRGLLNDGERCLLDVLERAPHAEFVRTNLNILRRKIKERSSQKQETGAGSDPDIR